MSDKKLTWQEAVLFLKDRGVTKIIVSYEGSGDSGSIDGIIYYKGEDSFNHLNIDISEDMDYELQNLCYPMLDNIEDWYNNDGGYGTVTIDLDKLHYDIANHVRYTTYEKYEHEGKLEDLTEE
jgi:hypothetical protein